MGKLLLFSMYITADFQIQRNYENLIWYLMNTSAIYVVFIVILLNFNYWFEWMRLNANYYQQTILKQVLMFNNFKGKYNFMSLEMLEKIDGRVIAILPITEVIRRVEQLGQEQNQPLQASRMLKYEQRPGIEVAPEDARADILEEPQETIELEPIEQHINHNKTTWETYKEAVQDKGAGPSQNKGSESDLDNLRQSKRTDKNEGLGRNKGLDGNKGVEETDGSKESEDEDSNDE